MRKQSLAVVVAVLGIAGCQSATEEHVGYVLLDQDAREAGYAVEGVNNAERLVLPIEVEPAVELSVIGPHGRIAVKPEADQLVLIHGVTGEIEHRSLAREVDPDRVVVKGSSEAAHELATVLGGKLVTREDGKWEIHATNAFAEASRIHAPAGLSEIAPAFLEESAPEHLANGAQTGSAERMALGGVIASVPSIARGGIAAAPGALEADGFAWDALLPPPVSCQDPVAGKWVSYHYHPNMGEWYVETVSVKRAAPGSSALVGQIRSEFWTGQPTDTKAPACSDDIVSGAVEMPAHGRVNGASFSISAQSFQIDTGMCKSGWNGGYSLDNFSGTIDGSDLHTVNNDGARAVNDATHFRHVSCR